MSAHKGKGGCPRFVECSGCGQLRFSGGKPFARHSMFETGPECFRSGYPPSEAELAATRNRERANQVMHWAFVIRDEDPEHVRRWIGLTDRAELEALMMTALAAIPDGLTLEQAFAWVKELA